jgi:hypothetical protein
MGWSAGSNSRLIHSQTIQRGATGGVSVPMSTTSYPQLAHTNSQYEPYILTPLPFSGKYAISGGGLATLACKAALCASSRATPLGVHNRRWWLGNPGM